MKHQQDARGAAGRQFRSEVRGLNMGLADYYEHKGVIGNGSFAVVARYQHRETGEMVAVKRLLKNLRNDDTAVRRFRKEYQILKKISLRGTGVTIVYEEFLAEPDFAFVMPLADGHLYDYIQRKNDLLTLEQRCDLFDRILAGVRIAHDHGILHRDLAPHNILMFGDEPAIADFGLGKDTEDYVALTKSSATGYGRAHYVAPELFASLKDGTIQSDIFSLGKILIFVMTGKNPDRLHASEFSRVARKATEEDPHDRFSSIADFEEMYESIKNIHIGTAHESAETVETLKGREIAWDVWHRAAVDGTYSGHVFYGYLDPVISHLLEEGRLEHYIDAIGNDVVEFAATFVKALDHCIGTVGWPFRHTTRFANFLSSVIRYSDSVEAQSLCLIALWDLAFVSNQFGAQGVVRKLLEGTELPEVALNELAGHIVSSKASVSPEKVGSSVPSIIWKAVLQAAPNN